MKITRLETLFVKPRWVFLKIHTDKGLVGWGEPFLEGWSKTTAAAVEEMGRYLLGRDPRRIEEHWQTLYRGGFYRGGAILSSAISGIEQALWDIKGKAIGAPVYELLGGRVRDKIRVYAHVGGDSLDAYVESAKARRNEGFTAFKTVITDAAHAVESRAFVAEAVSKFAALRDALGDEADIGIDFHGRINPALAKVLIRELERYHPMFIEEPCLPENVDALVEIARSTTVPIAAGERLYTRWGFRELLEKRAVAIIQPDLSHAGGILECRKIAAMAEAYYVSVAPHCPLGPIALAASLQLDACTPNFLCQEQVSLGEGYLAEPFTVENGHIKVPEGPGLGIEVDEDAVRERLYDGSWETPRLYHEDGSLADW